MNPVWHGLRLALETAAWFIVIGGAAAAVFFAMETWLHVRLFR
ncbi:MAG TPA: hypothetical protein VJ206_08255 [bacterium]|jgi:hypothetical protein|nr:hypothetical protein [bacterium]